MLIRTTITPAVLTAATGMLQQFIPELSPTALVSALKAYDNEQNAPKAAADKPLTRQEVADLLSVSLNSVNRYVNCGLLRRIPIGKRLVRIDPQSVRALLSRDTGAEA